MLDLERFATVTKAAGALLIVDAVSSFAALPIRVDAWGVDALIFELRQSADDATRHRVSGSLPGGSRCSAAYAAPALIPGLGAKSRHSDWSGTGDVVLRRCFARVWSRCRIGQNGREGIENVYARHVALARHCRAAVKARGLELFSPDDDASAALTAVRMPSGVGSTAVVQMMHEDWGVTIADGEARLKGSIVRIGHLGYVVPDDIDRAVDALAGSIDNIARLRRTEVAASAGTHRRDIAALPVPVVRPGARQNVVGSPRRAQAGTATRLTSGPYPSLLGSGQHPGQLGGASSRGPFVTRCDRMCGPRFQHAGVFRRRAFDAP